VDYLTTSIKLDIGITTDFSFNLIKNLQHAEDEIFVSNLKYIHREIWRRTKPIILIYTILNWVTIGLFFVSVIWYPKETILVVIDIFLVLLLLIYELIVCIMDPESYFKSKYNAVDILQYIAIPIILLLNLLTDIDNGESIYNYCISATMLVSGSRLITYLRVIGGVRHLIAMVLNSFYDMGYFLIVLVSMICLFGFIQVEISKTLEETEELKFIDYMKSFDVIYNTAYGNWPDSDELNKNYYTIFVLASTVLNLVMLNLIIAIINETFANFNASKEITDRIETNNILYEFSLFLRFWGKLFKATPVKHYLQIIKKREESDDIHDAMKDIRSDIQELKAVLIQKDS